MGQKEFKLSWQTYTNHMHDFCVITTNVTIKVQEEDSKIIFYQNIKVSCILVASVTIKLLVKLF